MTEPIRTSGTDAEAAALARENAALRDKIAQLRARLAAGTSGSAGAAFAAREQRMQAVLDASTAVFYAKDLAGRYVVVNRTFQVLFGASAEAILGQTDYAFFPRDTADHYVAHDRAVLEAGAPLHFEEETSVGGRRRTYLSVKFPLRDEAGAVYGVGGISTDITSQKEAEDALRASEARFRSTFENAAVGIAHVGLDGRWLRVNERLCVIVGYGRAELLEKTFQDITHPDDLEADLANVARLLRGEIASYAMEKRYLHRGGAIVWINLTVSLVRDAAGAPDYFISIVQDISERKAAEAALLQQEAALHVLNETLEQRVRARTAELERSNRDLDAFAYVASHDLKAPLRAIDGLASWVQEDAGALLPERSQRHLETLRGRVSRLERLLEDLLAYARQDRQHYEAETVDTGRLVRNLIELIAPPGFVFEVDPDMPAIQTVRVPLELVLRNLIGNAVRHHHRPDGRVRVSAQVRGAEVEFAVADDGPGIAEAFQERIFEMFQTLKPRDRVEGSGMGLAFVKKAVERRGGSVRVESVEGHGATFRFTWPLRED